MATPDRTAHDLRHMHRRFEIRLIAITLAAAILMALLGAL